MLNSGGEKGNNSIHLLKRSIHFQKRVYFVTEKVSVHIEDTENIKKYRRKLKWPIVLPCSNFSMYLLLYYMSYIYDSIYPYIWHVISIFVKILCSSMINFFKVNSSRSGCAGQKTKYTHFSAFWKTQIALRTVVSVHTPTALSKSFLILLPKMNVFKTV